MSDSVSVFEVGPRDGLQNEKTILSTADKIWLIQSLVEAGFSQIEAGSMVRADRVPQMADSEELHRALDSQKLMGDFYYLVPNVKGLERALNSGVKNIAVFTAASESFNKKNIGMSISESLVEIKRIIDQAVLSGIKVRGYVSTVFGCPFEGRVSSTQALKVVESLLSLPMDQVSIGDTIGVASVSGVDQILKPILSFTDPKRIAVHFHDTRGTALANAYRSFELGVRTFDASLGGLGGCPFAPGASGNLATEDLVYFFKEMGVHTGIHYKRMCDTSLRLSEKMGKVALTSRALQAYLVNCTKSALWDS